MNGPIFKCVAGVYFAKPLADRESIFLQTLCKMEAAPFEWACRLGRDERVSSVISLGIVLDTTRADHVTLGRADKIVVVACSKFNWRVWFTL